MSDTAQNIWMGKEADLRLVAFDLDGTLTESKSPLDREMSDLLSELLRKKKVAVASGASFAQFENQFLKHFSCPENLLGNLYLLPTNGARLYAYNGGWNSIYSKEFSEAEKQKIFEAFDRALRETGFRMPETMYGELVEDRGSQITFSAYGSTAPLALKKAWDPDHAKRQKIVEILQKYIPEFSIRIGGTTSIDVTMAGIDKAYGMRELMRYLDITKEQVLYVGDALFPGGNDASVLVTGIHTQEVAGLEDTKRFVAGIVSRMQ